MTDSPARSRADEPRTIPAGRRASGRLRVPPSKSVTNRYLALALLARRPVVLDHPLDSEDIRLFTEALRRCGFTVEPTATGLDLRPGSPPDSAEIDCGASGTMLRLLVAVLTTVPGRWRLDGIPRLRERTVGPLVDTLRRLGAHIEFSGRRGYAPLVVHGPTLRGGRAALDAGRSSQFLSAVLLAAQRASEPVTLEVRSLTSAPYVDLTVEAIRHFGGDVERDGTTVPVFRVRPSELRGGRHRVEGDYSAACYPAAAAALTGGRVELEGLRRESLQGDRELLALLQRMGVGVSWQDDPGGAVLRVTAGELEALTADLSTLPDQVPTLAALAPFAAGITHITNVPHLRIKESDRLAAMAAELERAGVPVEEEPAGLRIPGIWAQSNPPDAPVVLDPHGDHRIAMSCALVGLRRPGVAIATPRVVDKSYPGFWRDLDRLLGVSGG